MWVEMWVDMCTEMCADMCHRSVQTCTCQSKRILHMHVYRNVSRHCVNMCIAVWKDIDKRPQKSLFDMLMNTGIDM